MNRLAIATACGIGLAILAVALYAWHSMADSEMDANGVIALTLGIVATAVLATWQPARQAARIDPKLLLKN